MESEATKNLWAKALQLSDEVTGFSDQLLTLGLEVIQLLAEQRDAVAHSRTKEMYSEAIDRHGSFLHEISDLGREVDLLREQARPRESAEQVQEVLAKLAGVDPEKLADEELLAVCKRAWAAIQAAPDTVSVAVASTAISHFTLVHSHLEVLNALLDRDPLDRRILDGVLTLAKAAALDLGGTVFPFLGTLEALFEVATPQIQRDADSMRATSAGVDRLFIFGDQLSLLSQGVALSRANVRLASAVVIETNRGLERESRLLVDVFEGAAKD